MPLALLGLPSIVSQFCGLRAKYRVGGIEVIHGVLTTESSPLHAVDCVVYVVQMLFRTFYGDWSKNGIVHAHMYDDLAI